MKKQEFAELIEKGVVILDGAMGTNMMLRGMPKGVCTEQWILEHPEELLELQRAYVAAGTQILYAPTFGGNGLRMKSFGLGEKTEQYNKELVTLTKQAAAGKCLVAGDVGPTNEPEQDYDTLYGVYMEQMKSLVDAGVDLLVIETMYNMEESMAAIDAAHAVGDLPVICSMTVEADGSLPLGGNLYESAAAFEAMGVDAVGVNCSLGPDQLEAVVRSLHETVQIPLIIKPNAGVPFINDKGDAVYSMEPQQFATHMLKLIEAGASLVGGCCGTTPDYIRALKEKISEYGR
ncbi:MAG: homocysteine S-methyltransferase family protein [Lachnospiraceae bacterium]|nr:homocysteine S-methyltransferase family protein [Lachnospiraceae bacterium]